MGIAFCDLGILFEEVTQVFLRSTSAGLYSPSDWKDWGSMLDRYYPRNIILIGFKLLMTVVFLILQDIFVDIKEYEEIAWIAGCKIRKYEFYIIIWSKIK